MSVSASAWAVLCRVVERGGSPEPGGIAEHPELIELHLAGYVATFSHDGRTTATATQKGLRFYFNRWRDIYRNNPDSADLAPPEPESEYPDTWD